MSRQDRVPRQVMWWHHQIVRSSEAIKPSKRLGQSGEKPQVLKRCGQQQAAQWAAARRQMLTWEWVLRGSLRLTRPEPEV